MDIVTIYAEDLAFGMRPSIKLVIDVSNCCIIISIHLWLWAFEVRRGTSTGQRVTPRCVQARSATIHAHPCAVGLMEARGSIGLVHGSAWDYHTFCGSASITWQT